MRTITFVPFAAIHFTAVVSLDERWQNNDNIVFSFWGILFYFFHSFDASPSSPPSLLLLVSLLCGIVGIIMTTWCVHYYIPAWYNKYSKVCGRNGHQRGIKVYDENMSMRIGVILAYHTHGATLTHTHNPYNIPIPIPVLTPSTFSSSPSHRSCNRMCGTRL